MPTRWSEAAWLSGILAFYLLVGSLYAIYTPAWQAPDEPAHYNYVRYIVEHGQLPVLRAGDYPHTYLEQIKAARFPTNMSVAPLRYESWQPPLYYLLAVPVYRLWGGALLPLRLLSVVLGAGVVAAAYLMVRAIRPGDPAMALGTAAFVACLPMHLTVAASINNDVLAELLIGIVMVRVASWFQRPSLPGASLVITGLLLGLGLVTKLTVYYTALPLVVVGLWLYDRPAQSMRDCRRLVQFARRAAAVLVPAFLLALPWYVRNVVVYGWPDVIGKLNHDAVVVGQLRTTQHLAEVGWMAYLSDLVVTTFRSFWGQFGWMAVPMDDRTYFVLGLLSALAVVGCIVAVWAAMISVGGNQRKDAEQEAGDRRQTPYFLLPTPYSLLHNPSLILVAFWLVCAVAGYLSYNITFVQFQGRYLFPGLMPIGLLMVMGWRTILSRRWALVSAGVCGLVTASDVVGRAAGGAVDKWTVAVGSGATFALLVRRWLPTSVVPVLSGTGNPLATTGDYRRGLPPRCWDGWIGMLPLAGLAGLSLYSLFAFVVPNL
jgi:4-amino-4-deoxy-L-arabinose transferase-like glycosyltransferase